MIEVSISPIAFTIGALSIRWYGIFITLAILTVVLWTLRAVGKQNKITYDSVLTAAIVAIPSGIIVSRLVHVIDQWSYYSQNPAQIIGTGGLTIYGALLGGILGIWVYARISKLPLGYFFDLIVPAVPLAQAVGRVGCFLNGCCYGIETSLPWGVTYTNPDSFGPLFKTVHPTQLYEIVFLMISFGVIMKLRGRIRPEGSLFLLYLGLYSAWRFGIGFLRAGTQFAMNLQQAQFIALITMIITVSILAYRARWVKAEDLVKAEAVLAVPPAPVEPENKEPGD